MKYRKRPIVVEAERYTGAPIDGVCTGVVDEHGCCHCELMAGAPHVHTLEGVMTVEPGAYVIRGVAGELYPCRGEIFEATYEVAE